LAFIVVVKWVKFYYDQHIVLKYSGRLKVKDGEEWNTYLMIMDKWMMMLPYIQNVC